MKFKMEEGFAKEVSDIKWKHLIFSKKLDLVSEESKTLKENI